MSDLINELMSNEAVCRTAPATPGLSNTNHRNLKTDIPTVNTYH